MIPKDRAKFAQILVGFAAIKGRQLPGEALDLYWLSMQDWGIEEFQDAAIHLTKICEFMPTPKDFNDLRKAQLPTAGEAWGAVLHHAATGRYRSAPLDAATEKAVRAIGGWSVIAMCDEDKTHFLERRFAEHFDTMGKATETRRALPSLGNGQHLLETDGE